MPSLAITNIGTMLSGDLAQPVLSADSLLVQDGKISQVGNVSQGDVGQADSVINAAGSALLPGFIDSHFHVVFGDYQPRQKVVDFIDSYVHGGVTSMISAGEIHTPGRPRDAVGVNSIQWSQSLPTLCALAHGSAKKCEMFRLPPETRVRR